MRRLYLLLTMASVVNAHPVFADGIYQCKDAHGTTVFSQFPCGNDAKKITVDTVNPSVSDIATTQSANEQNQKLIEQQQNERHRNAQESRLSQYRQRLTDLQARRDAELRLLQMKKTAANNNLAGAVYENSISEEMKAVSEKYNQDIRDTQREIDRIESARQK